MIRCITIIVIVLLISCKFNQKLILPERNAFAPGGNVFYKQIDSLKWNEREPMMVKEILSGNVPSFLKKMVPIHTSIFDSITHKIIYATYFVTPDYLCIGSNDDFARVPMTPMTAQHIADSLHCFLPTRKMVDDIYKQATVKLEPVPLFAFRDSAITFYHHHLIIEGQRHNRKGLIAGIKKDLVISSKIMKEPKPNHEAIYGWHKTDGIPIQPLYTGHINWWVDYSHGIRLINRIILVEGKKYDYIDVLKDERLKKILCDEDNCSFYHYNY